MSRSSLPSSRGHRLRPPRLGPGDVERPRLTAAILATPDSGACVLSAPPGYGATTALAQALTNQAPVAWVSLDAFDSTPAHLHAQLSAAVSEACVAWKPPDLLEEGVLGMMAPFIESLADSGLRWLVLDGYDSEAHAELMAPISYLVANLPLGTRIAITTHDAARLVPIAPSSRRLVLLDQEQLQATDDEATRIVLATAPQLDVDAVEDITVAAQGWVAALASASRQAAQSPSENAGHWLLTRGASALLSPWLESLPSERRGFLESTALLTRLSGPLCDCVLERTDSLALLTDLEDHGGFLQPDPHTPPGAGPRWWSRHPLLSAALTSRASGNDDTERHLRAASWFESTGDLEEAMQHLLSAGRLDVAAETLKGNENALFESGKAQRVAEWYAALPPDTWGQMAWHLLRVGWGQAMSSDSAAGAATLAQLRAHLATSRVDETEQRMFAAEVAVLAAYLGALTGDTATMVASSRRAIELFTEDNEGNSQQIAPIILIRALLWNGDVESARRELTRIRFQPFPTGILRETAIGALKAQCLIDEGYVTQARREVGQALRWLTDHHLSASDVRQFTVMTAEGALLLESGESAAAVTHLEQTAEDALGQLNYGEGIHALLWLARARLAVGQPAAALADVQHARRTLQESAATSGILPRLDLTEAFIRYVSGDTVRAERLLQRIPTSDARSLLWARVTMHRQSSSLRRMLAPADTDSPRTAVDKQLLLALMAKKRSNALAEGHLLRAADLAEADGLTLALLGYPADLVALAAAVAQRSSHDFLAEMVNALTAVPRPTTPADLLSPALPVTAGPPLSPGELELITFLPRRDSNADIAAQLGVSVNTVKTRLYRLYRKLGVSSRDEAVEVARGRGLIS